MRRWRPQSHGHLAAGTLTNAMRFRLGASRILIVLPIRVHGLSRSCIGQSRYPNGLACVENYFLGHSTLQLSLIYSAYHIFTISLRGVKWEVDDGWALSQIEHILPRSYPDKGFDMKGRPKPRSPVGYNLNVALSEILEIASAGNTQHSVGSPVVCFSAEEVFPDLKHPQVQV